MHTASLGRRDGLISAQVIAVKKVEAEGQVFSTAKIEELRGFYPI